MISKYSYLDTPSLLIDMDIVNSNIKMMQEKANRFNLNLRPHIKTHKIPYLAKLQMEAGATGIACAKVGEAEIMAAHGISDIFIANEIIGISKYERLRELHRKVKIRVGIDNIEQLSQMESVFSTEANPLEVLIECEVGECRTGISDDKDLISLITAIKASKNVILKGVFSHEGHTYKADSIMDCKEKSNRAYEKTVHAANIIRSMGIDIDTVSIGSTPSVMNVDHFEGITELRLGTYIFFDVGQSNAINDYSHCAASVLASVISKPTSNRVVIDAGAKALIAQIRPSGICATHGYGCVKGSPHILIDNLFDEHGIIYNDELRDAVNIGDKIELIPSHVCPTVNLYNSAYLVSNGKVLQELEIECRGKTK